MTRYRSLARAIERRLNPRLTSILGSIYLTACGRTRCHVRFQDGAYIHRYRDAVIVDTLLCRPGPDAQDRDARDVFLFDYVPQPGDTVVDVGAGVGGEARLFSRLVGPAGRVVSIEAHPRTFRCLNQTVRMNGLMNVTMLRCAVVGRAGPVLLEDGHNNHGANSLTADPSAGVSVPGRTLDEIVDSLRLDRIHLLKMNIEGAERDVLANSVEALRRIDHLTVSCHDFKADAAGNEWQRTFDEVVGILGAAGFVIRTRKEDDRRCVPFYVYASRSTGVPALARSSEHGSALPVALPD